MDYILNIPSYNGPGVYCLTDNVNGKKYVGSSLTVKKRIGEHERSFKRGIYSKKMKEAIEDGHTFTCSILEEMPKETPIKALTEKEYEYISELNTCIDGYNTLGELKPHDELPKEKRKASDAIVAFGRDWSESVDGKLGSDYERGINTGLMIALHIVREVERNA